MDNRISIGICIFLLLFSSSYAADLIKEPISITPVEIIEAPSIVTIGDLTVSKISLSERTFTTDSTELLEISSVPFGEIKDFEVKDAETLYIVSDPFERSWETLNYSSRSEILEFTEPDGFVFCDNNYKIIEDPNNNLKGTKIYSPCRKVMYNEENMSYYDVKTKTILYALNQTVYFKEISKNLTTVYFYGSLDPISVEYSVNITLGWFNQTKVYNNQNIRLNHTQIISTDMIAHWIYLENGSGWIDETGNFNAGENQAILVNDSSRCIGGLPCYYYGPELGGSPSVTSNVLPSPDENVSFMVEVNFYNTNHSNYQTIAGERDSLTVNWDNANNIDCGMQQDTGTQYPSMNILDAGNIYGNTSYVFWCGINSTHLCGSVNGAPKTCIARSGTTRHNGEWWYHAGRDGYAEEPYMWSNGEIVWDEFVSDEVINAAYNSIIRRENLTGAGPYVSQGNYYSPIDTLNDTIYDKYNVTYNVSCEGLNCPKVEALFQENSFVDSNKDNLLMFLHLDNMCYDSLGLTSFKSSNDVQYTLSGEGYAFDSDGSQKRNCTFDGNTIQNTGTQGAFCADILFHKGGSAEIIAGLSSEIGSATPSARGFYLEEFYLSGTNYQRLRLAGGSGESCNSQESLGAMALNKWHSICVSWDGTNIYHFGNGDEKGHDACTITSATLTGTGDFIVGGSYSGTNINMSIDRFTVFNTNISEATALAFNNGRINWTSYGQNTTSDGSGVATLDIGNASFVQQKWTLYGNSTATNILYSSTGQAYTSTGGIPGSCEPIWTNQTNISVQNGTCNISDQYWQYWEWNMTNQCDSNYTTFSSNITASCDYCTPDIQNLTYPWVTYSACNESDLQGGARNITQWDVNQCQPDNITNQTFTEYNESACDFCTPSIINTTYNWFNNTPCNYTGYWNSTRITVQWDENQCVPDNITNQTFYEYNISSCSFCTTHPDCNLCDKCVAGACIPQTALEDLKDECSVSYTTCLNSYTLQGSNGLCDGSSACDTDSGFANVSAGNVCISGTDTNPTVIVNCGTWKQCIANTCGASEYYVGYAGDGTASCVDTDWVSAGSTWNAGSGDVIQTTVNAISCTTSTALFCNSADHCSGDTRYDGYTCDGSGNCDVDKTDIGCCQGSYCNSTSYCKEADYLCHDTATDYTCAASNLTSFGVTPQNDTQDLYDECPLVQCDGDAVTPYYALWSSLTCYYRNDTEGYCDGSLACTDQATLCSSAATDGSTGVTCDCEAAEIGCTGTTIGSCNNSICAACSPNWVNGTNVSLGNVTPCNISNQYLITYTWNMTNQCDSNYTAYYQNISASCDYCSYSLVYSDWSNYSNVTCGTRFKYTWDQYYPICCNLTGISSDCYVHNASHYDNLTVWGNYTEIESLACTSELGACDQVVEELKMIGVVLLFFGIIAFYMTMGIINKAFILKMISFCMAILEFLILIGSSWYQYSGGDISYILQLNFLVTIPLFLFIGFVAFFHMTKATIIDQNKDPPKSWNEGFK